MSSILFLDKAVSNPLQFLKPSFTTTYRTLLEGTCSLQPSYLGLSLRYKYLRLNCKTFDFVCLLAWLVDWLGCFFFCFVITAVVILLLLLLRQGLTT